MERTKIYKPEFALCPLCGSKLKYRYTVSNKVIQFSTGAYVRVKNLGYSCKNDECIDNSVIYTSQTASKLCVKGYTYSAKVLALIYILKMEHKSRDEICDYLAYFGIEISDRNIDIIHDKYQLMLNMDYKKNIELEYSYMMRHYGQIRLSIDSITVEEYQVVSIRDSFNSHQIGLHIFKIGDEEPLKKVLEEYVSNPNIKSIVTVRSFTNFFKILKEVVNRDMEYYYFEKM